MRGFLGSRNCIKVTKLGAISDVGKVEKTKRGVGRLLPRARALPDVTHGTLEGLGVVPESADGAIPKRGTRSIPGVGRLWTPALNRR